MTQCYVFAHSYNHPERLEGRLVIDSAKRIPSYAKQRFLDFLFERSDEDNDPSFDDLYKFVLQEENIKNSDFAIQVMSEEKGEKRDKSNNNRMSVKNLVTTNTGPNIEHAILHKPSSLHRDFVSKSAENRKIECFCFKLIGENDYHNVFSCREF